MPRTKLVVGLDVDDVMASVKRRAVAQLNEQFGSKIRDHEITTFKLEELAESRRVGIERHHVKATFREIWRDTELPIVDPNIPTIVQGLRQEYHVAITTATDAKDEVLFRWLKRHRIPYDDVIHVNGPHEKAKLGHIAVFVDDDLRVAYSVAATGRHTLLFEQPWNQEYSAALTNGTNGNASTNGFILPTQNWAQIQTTLHSAEFIALLRR